MSRPSWKWRGVFFISRLISAIGPPLHSLHWKILLLNLAVLLVPGLWFAIYERRHLAVIAAPALIGLAVAGALAYLLSAYLTRVMRDLAQRARRIAEGAHDGPLETWSQSELGDLGRALEHMRQRLEGKAYVEEMALHLSHELKTPLAAIRGAAELLEDGALLEETARRRFLANIQAEVQRLDQIVDNLLTLSRIETWPGALPAEPVHATQIVQEIVTIYRERAEAAEVELIATVPAEPVVISIAADSFHLLLSNLLENALQFTPAGGHIVITLAAANLTLRDTGTGIEPELLPKIFDRFFTTENPRTGARGTGLGLAIVKAICDRHGAGIEVSSTPGEGTLFTIALPANS